MLYQIKLESYEHMNVLKQYEENRAQELTKHTRLSKACSTLSWTP